MIAVLILAWAQSEEAKSRLNADLADLWREAKKEAVAPLGEQLKAIAGLSSGDVRILDLRLERFDLDSPPALEALSPERISLRLPARQWNLRIRAKVRWTEMVEIELKWKKFFRYKKKIPVQKTTHVEFAVEGLQARLDILMDRERLVVREVRPEIRYRLDLGSSNRLLNGLFHTIDSIVNSKLAKFLIRFVLERFLRDLVPSRPVRGIALGRLPSSVLAREFESRSGRMRDQALRDHLPHGTVVDLVRDSNATWYGRHPDSAIYTGHWLAGMALAYGVTRDPSFQVAAKRALEGIERLLAVGSSGSYLKDGRLHRRSSALQGRLVRYAVRKRDLEDRGRFRLFFAEEELEKNRDLPQPTWVDPSTGEEWVGLRNLASRDQYVGLCQGLTWAVSLLDDPDALRSARGSARKILEYLLQRNWIVDSVEGKISTSFHGQFVHQLAILVMGKLVDPQGFGERLEEYGSLSELVWFGAWMNTLESHYTYFQKELFYTSLSSLLLLDSSPRRRADYAYAHRILWRAVEHHQNPYFETVANVALYGRGGPPSPDVENGLAQWLDRPQDAGMPTDQVTPAMRDWLGWYERYASEPRRPQIGMTVRLGGDIATLDKQEPVSLVVIPIQFRVPRVYLWSQSPFQVKFSPPTALTRYPAADFQLCYWLARYCGVVAGPGR